MNVVRKIFVGILVVAGLIPSAGTASFIHGACATVTLTLTFSHKLNLDSSPATVDVSGGGWCIADDGVGTPPTESHAISISGSNLALVSTCEAIAAAGTNGSVDFTPAGPPSPSGMTIAYVGTAAGGTLTLIDELTPFVASGAFVVVPGGATGLLPCATLDSSSGVSSVTMIGALVFSDP